jgi:hypothetical protein
MKKSKTTGKKVKNLVDKKKDEEIDSPLFGMSFDDAIKKVLRAGNPKKK